MKHLILDKQVLYDLYIVENLSDRKVAQKLSCRRCDIRRNLRNYNIQRPPLKTGPKTISILYNVLNELYVIKEMSMEEINTLYSCGVYTIHKLLVDYGIKLRDRTEVNKIKSKQQVGKPRKFKNPEERMKYIFERREEKKRLQKEKIKENRDFALRLLGNHCFVCDSTLNLIFHHLKYVNGKMSGNYITTVEEVKQFSERFVLLCKVCHRDLHWLLRYNGRLEKFILLMQKHKKLEGDLNSGDSSNFTF